MTRVIVPLAKPAIAAVALFNFLYAWNDFFAPLLYWVSNQQELDARDRPVRVHRLSTHVQWNLTMAASLDVHDPGRDPVLPVQRVFIEGMTVTGVKG